MLMRATIVQLAGLVTIVGSAALICLQAGGVALGASMLFVGLAMERG